MYLRNCILLELPMDISMCNPPLSGTPPTGLLCTVLLPYGHLGNSALLQELPIGCEDPLSCDFFTFLSIDHDGCQGLVR